MWEAVKQIGKKPELLDEEGLEQKAIKPSFPIWMYLKPIQARS